MSVEVLGCHGKPGRGLFRSEKAILGGCAFRSALCRVESEQGFYARESTQELAAVLCREIWKRPLKGSQAVGSAGHGCRPVHDWRL